MMRSRGSTQLVSCYGLFMTVAELIEKLQALPADADVIGYEEGAWGEPEPYLCEPGEGFMGRTMERQTVIL